MMRFVMLALLVNVVFSTTSSSQPSQNEAGFFAPQATSIPQLVAQQQLFRKLADVQLGIQVSSQFYILGQAESQKCQGRSFLSDEDDEESDFSDTEDEEALKYFSDSSRVRAGYAPAPIMPILSSVSPNIPDEDEDSTIFGNLFDDDNEHVSHNVGSDAEDISGDDNEDVVIVSDDGDDEEEEDDDDEPELEADDEDNFDDEEANLEDLRGDINDDDQALNDEDEEANLEVDEDEDVEEEGNFEGNDDEDELENDNEEEEVRPRATQDEPDLAAIDLDIEEDGGDSFLELKTETGFIPGPNMGMNMMGMMGMGMMGMGMGYPGAQPQKPQASSESCSEIETKGATAKFAALKALQIQFYLAASDVEQSYWLNKAAMVALPPQMAVFKMYKSFLNTIALSTAIQFQDAFTLEAHLDSFNDIFGSSTQGSHRSEALAEQQVYHHWNILATTKYQLYMINLYEKMSMGQMMNSAHADNAAAGSSASSYLEVEAEAEPATTQFFSPLANPATFYAYIQYYQMYLRYAGIVLEMQLANTGLFVASAKVSGKGDQALATKAETTYLPQVMMQWAATNQQRYHLDYYGLMLDMYAPQISLAQAADRAENVFQNILQTEEPVAEAPKAN